MNQVNGSSQVSWTAIYVQEISNSIEAFIRLVNLEVYFLQFYLNLPSYRMIITSSWCIDIPEFFFSLLNKSVDHYSPEVLYSSMRNEVSY